MAKKPPEGKKAKDLTPRFGIGEWFGKVLTQMDTAERRDYASEVLRFLEEFEPKAFLFENVPRIAVSGRWQGFSPMRSQEPLLPSPVTLESND